MTFPLQGLSALFPPHIFSLAPPPSLDSSLPPTFHLKIMYIFSTSLFPPPSSAAFPPLPCISISLSSLSSFYLFPISLPHLPLFLCLPAPFSRAVELWNVSTQCQPPRHYHAIWMNRTQSTRKKRGWRNATFEGQINKLLPKGCNKVSIWVTQWKVESRRVRKLSRYGLLVT